MLTLSYLLLVPIACNAVRCSDELRYDAGSNTHQPTYRFASCRACVAHAAIVDRRTRYSLSPAVDAAVIGRLASHILTYSLSCIHLAVVVSLASKIARNFPRSRGTPRRKSGKLGTEKKGGAREMQATSRIHRACRGVRVHKVGHTLCCEQRVCVRTSRSMLLMLISKTCRRNTHMSRSGTTCMPRHVARAKLFQGRGSVRLGGLGVSLLERCLAEMEGGTTGAGCDRWVERGQRQSAEMRRDR